MKKIVVFFSSLFFATSLFAQSGKVYDNLSMPSKILGCDRHFSIYLPPDYETSQRSYPILYLLHGWGDNYTAWVQFGEVKRIADEAIRNGKATPMVIVMPDADTERKGYFNHGDGKWNYEDFFFEEFIPYIENKYKVKKDREFRAVAGLSMGGAGTYIYALHRPDLFSSACPLSAGTGFLSVEDLKHYIRANSKKGDPEPREEDVIAYYQKYGALYLIDNMPEEQKKAVRWYIDCGDDDFLYEGNSLAHIAMQKNNIPHEYRVRDGAHTWTYWRTALPEVLSFISQGFHRN